MTARSGGAAQQQPKKESPLDALQEIRSQAMNLYLAGLIPVKSWKSLTRAADNAITQYLDDEIAKSRAAQEQASPDAA